MHEALEEAERSLDVDLPHLRQSADFTADAFNDARAKLRENLDPHKDADYGLDVLAFGSMAREEANSQSDFDYLVVAHDVTRASPRLTRHFREAVEKTRVALEMGEPGSSGLFGRVIPAHQLVEQIGLEEDTNLTHTRRILVLEESTSLRPEFNRRDRLVYNILERYLLDYKDAGYAVRVPRFLLNDVLRYWYTVAVDYQAKRWDELDLEDILEKPLKWGVRYIKLRTSRKWTYAGSLVSLFMPVIVGERATPEMLQQQFKMPALARLAQLSTHFERDETLEPLHEILRIADTVVGWLDDATWRDAIRQVRQPRQAYEAGEIQEFVEAYENAQELQRHLQRLILSEEPLPGNPDLSLRELSKRYLLF